MSKRKPITQEISPANLESLIKESDRGCVVLMASLLDVFLSRIHEACVEANLLGAPLKDKVYESLTGRFGPLSTFEGKTTLAYAYGLIEGDEYEALNIIRKLRNEAAHEHFEFKFQDKGVTGLVEKLRAYERVKDVAPWVQATYGFPEAVGVRRDFLVGCLSVLFLLREAFARGCEQLLATRKAHKHR